MVAGALITMGTLGDRIGRRRLLLIGAGAFGAASVIAAFSRSAEMLIATRALLGLAGATLAPSTLSLIRNMFHDPQQRTVAIGVWITSYSAGAAIGPFLGGLMLQYFWWGSVFLLGVPVMILLLILGPVLLPEFRDPEAGRLDLSSAAMSLAAVLARDLRPQAHRGGRPQPPGGTVDRRRDRRSALAFIRRQRTLESPLDRPAALPGAGLQHRAGRRTSSRPSRPSGYTSSWLSISNWCLDMSPLEAGLWTLPWTAAFIVGSNLTPRLLRRFSAVTLMAAGLVVTAIGFALLTQVSGPSGFVVLIAGSAIYSLGLSPVFTLTNDIILGNAPPERAGSASAISETSSELGGALGIAILGSIGMAVYRQPRGRQHSGFSPSRGRGRRPSDARRSARGRATAARPGRRGAPGAGTRGIHPGLRAHRRDMLRDRYSDGDRRLPGPAAGRWKRGRRGGACNSGTRAAVGRIVHRPLHQFP